MNKIATFRGEYHFLSNFYQHPFTYKGLVYPNAEAAFQAQKCSSDADRIKYTLQKKPVRAKQMGKKEPNFPKNWDEISYDIMLDILRAKFSVPELAEMLESTGDAYLEEGNRWHDNRWGNCTCEKCSTKEGENWLGKILMHIRHTNRTKYMHIENLEKITSHLNRPALIALAARPCVGKTTIAMNIARYEAEHYSKNVVFFTFEMSEKQAYVKYNIQDKSSIHIIDDIPLTVSQMKEKLQSLGNIDLVIIDYLELIQSESEEKNRVHQFMDIGSALKKLSQELNVPIVILSQLSRGIDNRIAHHPILQDFKENLGIEQFIDTVMLLYRDSYPKFNEPSYYHFDNTIECIIAKNKYGEIGTIPLNCQLDFKVLQSNNEV